MKLIPRCIVLWNSISAFFAACLVMGRYAQEFISFYLKYRIPFGIISKRLSYVLEKDKKIGGVSG
jgi:hypothetical protein